MKCHRRGKEERGESQECSPKLSFLFCPCYHLYAMNKYLTNDMGMRERETERRKSYWLLYLRILYRRTFFFSFSLAVRCGTSPLLAFCHCIAWKMENLKFPVSHTFLYKLYSFGAPLPPSKNWSNPPNTGLILMGHQVMPTSCM